MIHINIKPKPKRSFAATFGANTVNAFLNAFAKIENDQICIDELAMMTFPKNLLN